jgi:predicted ATPase/DNA-binding winged helix-turn-helix (wHTH) protein
MTSPSAPVCYRFGSYEVQPGERRLLVNGAAAAIAPRAFDLLIALLERPGQLVTKDELLQRVWPKLVVEENNLQVQVSTLRKLLGADAIATVSGRGYRFTLDLEHATVASSPAPVGRKHNLPQPLTRFIGQEQSLAEYALLLEGARLLTLTGIGGCGKTRLAIKLAEMVLPAFPDGAWLVDLTALSDPERVALTVATTLGVREEIDKPIVETLCGFLSGKRMLLILDNCEHLVAACATLTERLLRSVSGLRVLVTSREGLGVAGERMLAVRSLSLLPAATEHGVDAMGSSEAVRLFVDRARLVAPEFALEPATASAVAEICRRLDGIPLAIELAAARVKLLSVEQIRSNLDDRFRLLTGGNKALPRHQTLRGVIQWSYEHLAAEEQQVLRRLAVFTGGWTVAAATAVAGDANDELAMVEMLGRLVDKSLVVVDREEAIDPRCRMLETVRQYAQERLKESGEGDITRARHRAHFLAFAEAANPQLRTDEAKVWLRRLDTDLPNLLEAHAWCASAADDDELGLRLAIALRYYLTHRGLIRLGRRMLTEALARDGTKSQTVIRAGALNAAGEFASVQGAHAEARAYFQESLKIAREHGDRAAVAVALLSLGIVATSNGDCSVGQEHLQQSLSLARDIGDDVIAMKALNSLGELFRMERKPQRARPLYEEALAISRSRGLIAVSAIILLNLGIIAIERADFNTARSQMAEAADFLDRIGNPFYGGTLLDVAAGLAVVLDDVAHAVRIWGASEALAEKIGRSRDASDQQFLIPLIARAKRALGDATFGTAYAAGHALSYEEAMAEVRIWLEKVAVATP